MIRQATTDDFHAILPLCVRMHAESPRYGRLRYSAAHLQRTFAHLVGRETGFLWVAEHDGQLVGVMAGLIAEHWGSPDKVATDLMLYVLPVARRTGVAAELVAQYKQWAKHRGAVIPQVGVSAGIDDDACVAMYKRQGFRPCGTILEA